MAKGSGGARNYAKTSTFKKREDEFNSLILSGNYDKKRSMMAKSGGFVVTHNDHDKIINHEKDKSDIASELLAKKGYKVYLDSEKSQIDGVKMPDGRIYKTVMDIKTINEAGNNTIKNRIREAGKQGAEVAILYQNTKAMDKTYVENQINDFSGFKDDNSMRVKMVIVVGMSGNIHRHIIKRK